MAKIYGVTNREQAKEDYSAAMEDDVIGNELDLEEETQEESQEPTITSEKPDPFDIDYSKSVADVATRISRDPANANRYAGITDIFSSDEEDITERPEEPTVDDVDAKTPEQPLPTTSQVPPPPKEPTAMQKYEASQDVIARAKQDEAEIKEESYIEEAKAYQKKSQDYGAYINQSLRDLQVRDKNNVLSDQKKLKDLDDTLTKIKEMSDELYVNGGGKVDPDQYMGDGITWRRIGAAISIFMAGVGGPAYLNAAIRNINGAIDRNISAQKSAITLTKEGLAGYRTLYKDQVKLFGEGKKADTAARMQTWKIVELKLKFAANAADTEVKKQAALRLAEAARVQQVQGGEGLKKLDPTPLGEWIFPHQLRNKVQRERYVPMGSRGGMFAVNQKLAAKASEEYAKYKPLIFQIKKLKDFFSRPENASIMGISTGLKPSLGEHAARLEILHNELLDSYRIIQGSGASFTMHERGIIEGIIGKSFNSFTGMDYYDRFKMLERTYTTKLSTILSAYGIKIAPQALLTVDLAKDRPKVQKRKR